MIHTYTHTHINILCVFAMCVLGPLQLELQVTVSQKSNSDPLEKQQVLLPVEPASVPPICLSICLSAHVCMWRPEVWHLYWNSTYSLRPAFTEAKAHGFS